MQARRNHYLQAMGIQVWQTRDKSPAVMSELPVEAAGTTQAEPPVAPSVPQSAPEPSALSAALNADAAPASTDNIQTSPLTPQVVDGADNSMFDKGTFEKGKVPEFRFASIVFPGICVVVTQVAQQVSEPVTPQHLTYLNNLLQAVGQRPMEAPQITLFNWPMLRSANFDQGAEAALEASRAFLRAQKARCPIAFVLLMGEAPGRYLLPEATCFEQDKGQLCKTADEPLLLTDSVEQVFADPLLKAGVWQHLQPLSDWLGRQGG